MLEKLFFNLIIWIRKRINKVLNTYNQLILKNKKQILKEEEDNGLLSEKNIKS